MDNFLTTKQVADILGLSAKTLINWRSLEKGPAIYKFGRMVRYRQSDVEDFIAAASLA